jgi:HK97 family phage major capsid protein
MKHLFINLHRDAATETKGGFSAEENAQLRESFSKIETALGTKMADKVKKAVEDSLSPFQKEVSDLKQYKVDAEKAAVENQKALDELIAKGQRVEVKATENNIGAAIQKAFEEKKDDLVNYTKTGRRAIQFEVKVVGNIGSGNISVSGTPAFIPGPGLWEPGRKPYEIRHIREFLRVVPQPAGMDTYVIRMTTQEGAPTSVAVGAAKPQSDIDWLKTIVPITKIAHFYKVPEEYLADIPWIQDEISGVGVEELLVLEDSKILTNSAGGEFLGLDQTFNSTAYSTPASLLAIFTGSIEANNYDVLVAAWTQLRVLHSTPTGVLMNPIDYAAMILAKDLNGGYVFGAPNQSIPNLFGAPIVPHTAVTSDKFFVGDFTKVKVGVRAGLSVRFYDQNEDDAIKNLVTVVIEERITMAADRTDRVIFGDFSDAQAALES